MNMRAWHMYKMPSIVHRVYSLSDTPVSENYNSLTLDYIMMIPSSFVYTV